MLKKIGISTAILLASSTVTFADNIFPYFGGEIGYDAANWKLKDVTSVSTTSTPKGVFGGLFAGLNWSVTPNFVLNPEIFGSESSTRTSNQTINVTGGGAAQARLRLQYSYGGSILPGFVLNNSGLVYLRLGIIRSGFYLHQSVPPANSTSNWSKNNVGGGQVGIGLQAVLGHWGVRGEYDYVGYKSFTAFGNNISAYANQFKIGVLYDFC